MWTRTASPAREIPAIASCSPNEELSPVLGIVSSGVGVAVGAAGTGVGAGVVFGVGCVFGYLGYYYTNTSLSASYTTEERYRENTHMTQVLAQENTDIDPDSTVTTIESAYKKFLTDETTYTVAVYTVNEEALSGYDKDLETIRGMSKSKAKAVAEDGVMEKVGTATIVLNTKTDEVLSFSMK